jgi:predicted Zn finger-like uncharacterized protein
MPEVVQCPECERQLRVPDNLLGKAVKCPSCGTTFMASGPAAAPEAEPLAAVPAPEEPPAEPRRPERPRPPEERYPDEDEGYDDFERGGRRASRQRALAAVRPPAICLLVAAVLGLLADAYGAVDAIVVTPQALEAAIDQQIKQQRDPEAKQMMRAWGDFVGGLLVGPRALVMHAVFALMNLVILLGSIMMLAGRARWLGILASILALVNLDCCCCLLGIPFGIWSLVALSRPDVKATFH